MNKLEAERRETRFFRKPGKAVSKMPNNHYKNTPTKF